MGAANGKEASQQSEAPHFDIRISQRLFEELDGKPRGKAPSRDAPQSAGRGGREGGADAAAVEEVSPGVAPQPQELPRFQNDALLQEALRQTTRVGHLLLKRGQEEQEKIAHLAQELLDKEYRTPSRALQCSKERDACRDCYQGNAAQPLACAAAVDAFTRCADTALRACDSAPA